MDSVISRLIIRDTPRIMWSRHSMAVAVGSLSAAFGWATANTHSRHARLATMKIDRWNFAKISRATDRHLIANSDSSSIDRYAG
jgi:hypothetical protein